MNHIAFRRGRFRFGDSRTFEPIVQIFVDGRDLFDVIEVSRSPRAQSDDEEPENDLDDSPGVPPDLVRPPSKHWLGVPGPAFSEGKRALIYDCECGHWPCGGTLVRIDVLTDQVVWSHFAGSRGGAGRDGYPVGPLQFDRFEYESALASIPPA